MSLTALENYFRPEGGQIQAFARFAGDSKHRTFIEVFDGAQPVPVNPGSSAVRWNEVRYTRTLAPIMKDTSPAKTSRGTVEQPRTSVPICIKDSVIIPGQALFSSVDPSNIQVRANPQAVLARYTKNLANKIQRTKNYAFGRCLLGSLNTANVPGSDYATTITWPTLAISASASWATAGTNIRETELTRLKRLYEDASYAEAQQILMHPAVDGYLALNTDLLAFMTSGGNLHGNALQNAYKANGGTFDQLMLGGMNWRSVKDRYAASDTADDASAAGTADQLSYFIDDDYLIVLPDAETLSESLGVAECWTQIPNGIVVGDAMNLVGQSIREVQGYWIYAVLLHNPIRLQLIGGWSGLPVQIVPRRVAAFNTTP